MNSKLKRIFTIMLVMALIFSIPACGVGADDDSDISSGDEHFEQIVPTFERSGAGNPVTSPVEGMVLVDNDIEIIDINAFTNGEPKPEDYPTAREYYRDLSTDEQKEYDVNEVCFSGQYIQISGLEDKEIEAEINAKIKQLFIDSVYYVPPYRGIRAFIGEDPTPLKNGEYFTYISMYAPANFNNILSVVLDSYTIYKDVSGGLESQGNGKSHYVSYIETLNFDLTTGNEIALETLVCDDIDPEEFFNNVVKENLIYNEADEEGGYGVLGIQLTGKFEGVRPDQKYYIDDSEIYLIFDHETPEISTMWASYSSTRIEVPLGGEIAITERF